MQVGIYLCLVVLSVLVTALLLSTVVMHRTFFQRRIKGNLVDSADLLLRLTLVLVGLILIGTVGLVFDLVLSGTAGAVAAVLVAVTVVLLWLLLPLLLRRRALRQRAAVQDRPGGTPPQR